MSAVKKSELRQLRGWVPDLPDPRDLNLENAPACLLPGLRRVLNDKINDEKSKGEEVDLREHFPAVDEAGDLPSTVAQACGSVVEYFRRRCLGRATSLASGFLHETACRLHDTENNLSIRQVLVTLRRVGIPPASLYNRVATPFDPLLFAFAADYAELQFLRVDAPGVTPKQVLNRVRRLLQLGIPAVFGMPVLAGSLQEGWLDLQRNVETIGAGAGAFVGYDESSRHETLHCFYFRSSWGCHYGQQGYGRLSYRFCEHLVRDVWILLHPAWLQTGDLPLLHVDDGGHVVHA